jgi:hypothetical protein
VVTWKVRAPVLGVRTARVIRMNWRM